MRGGLSKIAGEGKGPYKEGKINIIPSGGLPFKGAFGVRRKEGHQC